MMFSFHLSDGWDFVESFWNLEPLDERLVLGEYVRQGVMHTVFIRWFRSHDSCVDLEFGLYADRATVLYPDRGKKHRLITQEKFKSFFDRIRDMDVAGGIRSRFAYPLEPSGFNHQPAPSIRFTRFSLEFLDENGNLMMEADHLLYRGEWLIVLAPTGRAQFLKEPVSDNFFAALYEKACVLGKTLGNHLP